jgi:hypothetical protein
MERAKIHVVTWEKVSAKTPGALPVASWPLKKEPVERAAGLSRIEPSATRPVMSERTRL